MITLNPSVSLPLELQHVDPQLQFIIQFFQIFPTEHQIIDHERFYILEKFNEKSGLNSLFNERYTIELTVYIHVFFLNIYFVDIVNVAVFVPYHERSQVIQQMLHDFGADIFQTVSDFQLVVVEHS